MAGHQTHAGLAEPPEAALAGENVPNENDAADQYPAAVAELVGLLKTHPGYEQCSDQELREEAAEYVKRLHQEGD